MLSTGLLVGCVLVWHDFLSFFYQGHSVLLLFLFCLFIYFSLGTLLPIMCSACEA
jgi:hypothetical protein